MRIYFWGEGVAGFMPLFRCIYFFYIFFLKSLALCLFLDVFIHFFYIDFFKVYLFFYFYFFAFFGGGGWA